MNKRNDNIQKGLEMIRAAYTSGVYVGGSYGRHLVMPQYNYNDIDVFICGPRRMEQWVTDILLAQLFDTVDNKIRYDQDDPPHPENPDSTKYMMEHQHGRIVCTLGDVTFDLIYLDTDINHILVEQTASSLSCFYHEITFDTNEMLHLVDHPITREAIGDLIIGKVCVIHKGRCTDEHLTKIKQVCGASTSPLHLDVKPVSSIADVLTGTQK